MRAFRILWRSRLRTQISLASLSIIYFFRPLSLSLSLLLCFVNLRGCDHGLALGRALGGAGKPDAPLFTLRGHGANAYGKLKGIYHAHFVDGGRAVLAAAHGGQGLSLYLLSLVVCSVCFSSPQAISPQTLRVRVQLIRHVKTCTTDIYLHNECAHVGLSVHAPVGPTVMFGGSTTGASTNNPTCAHSFCR
eukprot:COSAG05_NODE_3204_length_2245_cov_3.080615_3_plen_191_part_00